MKNAMWDVIVAASNEASREVADASNTRRGLALPRRTRPPTNALLADRELRDLIQGINEAYDALDFMMATDGDAFECEHRARVYNAMRTLQTAAHFLDELRLNGRA